MAAAPLAPVVALIDLTPPPSQAVTVPALAKTAAALLVDGECLLTGWALAGGATAGVATFYDSADSTGQVVGLVALAASGSSVQTAPGPGVHCARGLSIHSGGVLLASVVWVVVL